MQEAFRIPDFGFVHAADLHLDTPFKGIGETAPFVAERLREASLAAFDSLVELCIEYGAALVVAGDIYDGPERAAGAVALSRRSGPAFRCRHRSFIVHGNHDPVETGWSALSGPWPDRVTVFGSGEVGAVPVQANGVPIATVQGISFAQRSERENLAKRFVHKAGPGVQVGVLHCNVRGAATGYDDYSPCTLEELRDLGLDYWALGHIHTQMVLAGRSGSDEPWVVYPGNLQARSPKPSERGPKGAMVVHVRGGRIAEVEPVSCDIVRFGLIELDMTSSSISPNYGRPAQSCRSRASRIGRWTLFGVARTAFRPRRPHSDLCRQGRSRSLLVALREDFAERDPFCWWDSIDDRSRPEIDLDVARSGSDFAADLVAIADELKASLPPSMTP